MAVLNFIFAIICFIIFIDAAMKLAKAFRSRHDATMKEYIISYGKYKTILVVSFIMAVIFIAVALS